jgi:predicted RNA-binding protein with PIN domain
LAELSEYKKYRDINMIVVFDAMYVPGNSKSFRKFDMEIVWTSKDQTADSYIEALSRKKQNRFTQVIVATSDQAEQWTIFAAGALRIPARELLRDVQRAKQEVDMEAQKMTDKSHALRQTPWNPKQLMALEKLRDNLTDKDNK